MGGDKGSSPPAPPALRAHAPTFSSMVGNHWRAAPSVGVLIRAEGWRCSRLGAPQRSQIMPRTEVAVGAALGNWPAAVAGIRLRGHAGPNTSYAARHMRL